MLASVNPSQHLESDFRFLGNLEGSVRSRRPMVRSQQGATSLKPD
jgi:hypothetical protein